MITDTSVRLFEIVVSMSCRIQRGQRLAKSERENEARWQGEEYRDRELKELSEMARATERERGKEKVCVMCMQPGQGLECSDV